MVRFVTYHHSTQSNMARLAANVQLLCSIQATKQAIKNK
jgi:hypothetical protein